MSSSKATRPNLYRSITERIIAAIKAGAGTYTMPWHSTQAARGRPQNPTTGNQYRGGNVVALWAESTLVGYRTGYWASYKQWKAEGAQVRHGERGTLIIFYKLDEPEEGQGRTDRPGKPLARASYVFNADQVDGWRVPMPPTVSWEPHRMAEVFIANTGARIVHGFPHAGYNRSHDRIELPDPASFRATSTSSVAVSYYATALHELIHWTGADTRLKRVFGQRFGDAAYAAEELVAEIGAAFLCADLGLANEPRADHAAYLGHWLAILDADPYALFAAARLATSATTYLHESIGPQLAL